MRMLQLVSRAGWLALGNRGPLRPWLKRPTPHSNELSTAAAASQVATLRPAPSGGVIPGPMDSLMQPPVLSRPAPEPAAEEASRQLSPAESDAMRFSLDKSVEDWRGFADRFASNGTAGSDITVLLRKVLEKSATKDARSAAFWAYHAARLTFFVSQAVTGLVAHDLSERLDGLMSQQRDASGSQAASSGGSSSTSGQSNSMLERMMGTASVQLTARVAEAVGMWMQDLECIEAGLYKLPWDMTTLTHRQYNPLFALRRTALFASEAAQTLRRRVRESPDAVWLQGPAVYPDYYSKTFHYQTDGWLSARSAEVYETSTEVLFFGRQDAMQRSTLVPISRYISASNKPTSSMRLLEVAAGTGRFHTFLKDNWPELPSVVSDLSPFYLAKARENVHYWRTQVHGSRSLGVGPDGDNVEYLQTAAEAIAAPSESFDIVVAIYLFHELPEEVRRRATAEFFRVLRPGGLMVLNDSAQLGDRPEWDRTLSNFSNFNEPFYKTYTTCDLGRMFEDAGFVAQTKTMASASKVLSFVKP